MHLYCRAWLMTCSRFFKAHKPENWIVHIQNWITIMSRSSRQFQSFFEISHAKFVLRNTNATVIHSKFECLTWYRSSFLIASLQMQIRIDIQHVLKRKIQKSTETRRETNSELCTLHQLMIVKTGKKRPVSFSSSILNVSLPWPISLCHQTRCELMIIKCYRLTLLCHTKFNKINADLK